VDIEASGCCEKGLMNVSSRMDVKDSIFFLVFVFNTGMCKVFVFCICNFGVHRLHTVEGIFLKLVSKAN
jgi:hypothetical protein